MNILGIETATQVCSVALLEDKTLLGELSINQKNVHAEKLFGLIQQLLANNQLNPKKINAVAISIGPGSFTGLRIGLSAAKGFVFAVNAKLVAVSTLQALAKRAPEDKKIICTLIGARKGESYYAVYERKGREIVEKEPPCVLANESLVDNLPARAYLIGPGISALTDLQQLMIEKSTTREMDKTIQANAIAVAQIGYSQLQHGIQENPITVEPYYLQDFITSKPG